MNVVEMKTSSLILFSVIWLPDCPDARDAITDYTRTENTQPACTCSKLYSALCPVFRDGPSSAAGHCTGKVWENKLSTPAVIMMEWNLSLKI